MNSRTRTGELVAVYDGQGGAIRFLYENPLGQLLLRVLIQPWVSRTAGWFLDRPLSRCFIRPFVEKNRLDLSEYPRRSYCSFNDFFTRRISPEKRPVDMDPCHLIAPCDGKLTAYTIGPDSRFHIKGVDYDLEGLLRDARLAQRYEGGTLLLFRLSVDDYHRYCYVCDGEKSANMVLDGVLHTVNPFAAERRPLYRENCREYCLLETERFGTVLTMEVGAMMVGRIVNHHQNARVSRGQEKGYFAFGGSSIVLLLERDRVRMDRDILQNSAAGEETVVRMGEKLGQSL